MQWDTELGHTINTAGGDCSLPTIGVGALGTARLQMLNAAKYKWLATKMINKSPMERPRYRVLYR